MHRGRPVDVAALQPPDGPRRDERAPFPFIIVPGYTPRFGWRTGLHPRAVARLERALAAVDAGLAPSLIVSGGAVHSPDNEALLMREWLVERGLDPARIVVEPCARHTTTNLRNSGRILLGLGHTEALVVTSDCDGPWRVREQAFSLGRPWLSGFHARCLLELGYRVGELEWLAPHQVRFRPSRAVLGASWKETLMGDP
jgi:hypothetical protein